MVSEAALLLPQSLLWAPPILGSLGPEGGQIKYLFSLPHTHQITVRLVQLEYLCLLAKTNVTLRTTGYVKDRFVAGTDFKNE